MGRIIHMVGENLIFRDYDDVEIQSMKKYLESLETYNGQEHALKDHSQV